jgi:dTDP-4-dehydrorhamnose 3,5-epimerase
MISGVIITPLRQIKDERGKVMHMLKATDPHFIQFGEIYFSCINPGAVKAWNCHQELTANLAVIQGEARLVLFDDREESETRGQLQTIELGDSNYCLVTIPPKIWLGFTATSQEAAIIANCATLPHRREESLQRPSNDPRIPYSWER